jgi:uncharacterized membrane protein YbhN (UPF0104 family)
VSRAERERGALAHRWNRWRRWFWLVFAAFVLFVLWRAAAHLDWREVGAAIAARDVGMLLLIAAGALASHALFATLDVLSRRFAGLRLRSGRVWLTATVCYAAALNLGALIGSLGLRVRLYRRQGVRGGAISRMVAAGVLGNWSGHFALLALVPWFASEATRARWSADVGGWPVSLVAATMLLAYFALVARGVPLRWRQRRLRLPPLRVALAQLAVATANWALMGALLYLGIGSDRIAYADVLIALLFAAVAGVITHVPGGWGVLEFAPGPDRATGRGRAAVSRRLLPPAARARGRQLRLAGAGFIGRRQARRGACGHCPATTRPRGRRIGRVTRDRVVRMPNLLANTSPLHGHAG